ncbi:predicted protein [Plenodomus lingam JN3]|uniref:Predicted protein n=1 Tax=Leptosphaeria maculans (strain JN3 / isolate v23.1.3 / race Av1-4-5-6-7-8) TaxID=985895 RepID=E4ZJ40_LEPMJ|nr:predicted protein [Plenodomus lingam JN3]CBX91471.1 predicted protein [Plenodomus lingam JN3]
MPQRWRSEARQPWPMQQYRYHLCRIVTVFSLLHFDAGPNAPQPLPPPSPQALHANTAALA